MSFVVADAISDMNQELNLIGQRMQDADYILFLNRANKYFYTNYKMPTSQARTSLIAYPGVKEYGLPGDYVGLIEPERPYSEWSPNFNHTTEKEFVHWPYGRTTAVKFERETPFLIFSDDTGSKAQIGIPEPGESQKILTSFGEANRNGQSDVHAGAYDRVGQTFSVENSATITQVRLYLKKFGSPTGLSTVTLWSTTGTIGVNAVPVTQIAISDSYDISALTTDFQLITFTFSGVNQVNLSPNTTFALSFDSNNGNSSNYISVGDGNGVEQPEGCEVYKEDSFPWGVSPGYSLIYYVLGIEDSSSSTAGGTVTLAGDGSNLSSDKQNYTEGSFSLRFDVAASSGYTDIILSDLTPMDLSEIFTQGGFFVDIFAPPTNTVDLTSVSLSIGSDVNNTQTFSATTRYRGDRLGTGWGQVGFIVSNSNVEIETTAITYIKIRITHGLTGIAGTYRVDNLFGATGTFFEIPYYSKYNVKSNAGVYQEKITATTDTVLCPSDFDEAFTYKTLEIAAAMRLRDAAMANYAGRELLPKELYLKSKYPRQESRTQMTWYKGANRF